MRLGEILGVEGKDALDRAAYRQRKKIEKQARKNREREANRARTRGDVIRYHSEG